MERIKFFSNERVGLSDMEAGAGGILEMDNRLREARIVFIPSGRTSGNAATSARIFSGFTYTVPGGLGVGNSLVLMRGTGIFPIYDQGVIKYGVIFGEHDPLTLTLSVSALAPGTYGLWVRFVLSQTDNENRVFWNESTATEEISQVPTRERGIWDAVLIDSSAGAPGSGEYVKIYQVTIGAGPVVSAIADYRHFFYEGDAYGAGYADEWGNGVNDRSANRAAYPIADLHTFVHYVRSQLRDIIDPTVQTNHVKDPPIDLQTIDDHITDLGGTGGAAMVGTAVQGVNRPNDGLCIISPASLGLAATDVSANMAELLTYLASGMYRGGNNHIQGRDDNTTAFLLKLIRGKNLIESLRIGTESDAEKHTVLRYSHEGLPIRGVHIEDFFIHSTDANIDQGIWYILNLGATGIHTVTRVPYEHGVRCKNLYDTAPGTMVTGLSVGGNAYGTFVLNSTDSGGPPCEFAAEFHGVLTQSVTPPATASKLTILMEHALDPTNNLIEIRYDMVLNNIYMRIKGSKNAIGQQVDQILPGVLNPVANILSCKLHCYKNATTGKQHVTFSDATANGGLGISIDLEFTTEDFKNDQKYNLSFLLETNAGGSGQYSQFDFKHIIAQNTVNSVTLL